MSIHDAEIFGLSAVGYDEFAIAGHDEITDSYLLADNRAYRTGEISDRLYPLSTFRGGWSVDGSGVTPDIDDVGTYASQMSSPMAPNPPGRNISIDRNRPKRGYGSTIGELAREKIRSKKTEHLDLGAPYLNGNATSTKSPTLGDWWRGLWTPENISTNLITLVFILMITIVVMQVFHNQRIYKLMQTLMIHTIPIPKKSASEEK